MLRDLIHLSLLVKNMSAQSDSSDSNYIEPYVQHAYWVAMLPELR